MDRSAVGSSPCGWAPSNTHPPNTKVVASCLDTLYLGYRGALVPAVLAELEEKRALLVAQDEAARAAWEDGAAESEILLAGTRFVLRPSIHHGYRFRLYNDDLALMVNPKPPPGVPAIMAQLRALFLWREGWQPACAITSTIARALQDQSAKELPAIVSRLDACADFQGWIPCESDSVRFVSRARKRDAHHVGGEFTGFTLGKGALLARLYDKSAELAVSGKDWMRVLWAAGGYDPAAHVWRLEFQLRREVLRETHVSELSDIHDKLGRLWSYLTSDWLRLAVPARGDRPERWPLDPHWEQLRRADFGSAGGALVRERKRSADMARLESQLLGLLTSHAALAGRDSLGASIRAVERAHRWRLGDRGEEFSNLVARKARRIGAARDPVLPVHCLRGESSWPRLPRQV